VSVVHFPLGPCACWLFYMQNTFEKELDNDLAIVMGHANFNRLDVPKNYDAFKSNLLGMPLLPVCQAELPSTSLRKATSIVYFLEPLAFLKRLLNRKLSKERIPVKTDHSQEYWHGRLYRESPLFNPLSPLITPKGWSLLFSVDRFLMPSSCQCFFFSLIFIRSFAIENFILGQNSNDQLQQLQQLQSNKA